MSRVTCIKQRFSILQYAFHRISRPCDQFLSPTKVDAALDESNQKTIGAVVAEIFKASW